MLNGLSLFSGIGGIDVGLSKWVRPIMYCEIDRYCQGVLGTRMRSGDLPIAPIWDDVKSLNGNRLRGMVDIIFGGFPCQDISVAGDGEGLDGERSGLFFEIARLVSEIRPRFVFLENVSAITVRGLDRVCGEFSELRYDCRWGLLSAFDVGEVHQRERWFMLAHSNSEGLEGSAEGIDLGGEGEKLEKHTSRLSPSIRSKEAISEYLREHDGSPKYMDRIRCLGNGCVPQQAEEAFKRLMGLK